MSRKEVKDSAQVADSVEKLYSELPSQIFQQRDTKKTLKEFLAETLPQSERKEIDDEFKKTLSLTKGQKAKKVKPVKKRRPGQYLTAKERRSLGLNRLPKRGLNFEDFHPMHDLWLDYMRKVVGNSAKRPQVKETSPSTVHTLGDEQLQMRVSRADLHGAFVKVVKAPNPKLIGMEGYIVMETRNTFQLVTKRSKRKIVPKSGTYFTFCVDEILFTVDGSTMCMKPSERAVKKWKNKPPLELIV